MEEIIAQGIILGNTVEQLTTAFVVFIVVSIAGIIFRVYIIRFLEKMVSKDEESVCRVMLHAAESFKSDFYYVVAAIIALNLLTLPDLLGTIVFGVLWIWVVYRMIGGLRLIVTHTIHKTLMKSKQKGVTAIGKFMDATTTILIWIIAVLLILSNLGVNITSLVAGLGVGGLAIALSLRKVFEDLFSTFTIYADNIMEVGDYVKTGKHDGVVERIGLRATVIRDSQGKEVIIPNSDITGNATENSRNPKDRKITVAFYVGSATTQTKKLENISKILGESIDAIDGVDFISAGISDIDLHGILISVSYKINNKNLSNRVSLAEAVNVAILKSLESNKIKLATSVYPVSK
ncbi:MAG: mechanosensitive ion channel [Candidatus Campbellbacteria bacterium]|nr:mechanosensitive ion channel [Candidatus Campbellbacteria bacterium]